MEVLTQTELRLRLDEVIDKIKKGALFIHPTDTIYGIGCNALNASSVEKIRRLKERPTSPFSVWVPSLGWIQENCQVNKEGKHWINRLPGPLTLLLPLKNKKAIASNVIPGLSTIGIRHPNHWFIKVIKKCGVPIITTSANKSDSPFMTKIENLDSDIEKEVDFMIYEGEKKARPSKIINTTDDKIIER